MDISRLVTKKAQNSEKRQNRDRFVIHMYILCTFHFDTTWQILAHEPPFVVSSQRWEATPSRVLYYWSASYLSLACFPCITCVCRRLPDIIRVCWSPQHNKVHWLGGTGEGRGWGVRSLMSSNFARYERPRLHASSTIDPYPTYHLRASLVCWSPQHNKVHWLILDSYLNTGIVQGCLFLTITQGCLKLNYLSLTYFHDRGVFNSIVRNSHRLEYA